MSDITKARKALVARIDARRTKRRDAAAGVTTEAWRRIIIMMRGDRRVGQQQGR